MRESQLNQCERYFSRMIKNKSNVLFSEDFFFVFKYLSKKKNLDMNFIYLIVVLNLTC
jgi:hypothetical protein